MKLTRFHLFAKRALSLPETVPNVTEVESFYRFDDIWYDARSRPVVDHELTEKLGKALNSTNFHRGIKSNRCFFPIADLEAAVTVNYTRPPRAPTPLNTSSQLAQYLAESTNEYRATHDSLTGLLNGEAFRRRLVEKLKELATVYDKDSILPDSGLAVIMADLDFFKQVNDSHGHLFGDLVLAALALNLEASVMRWQEDRASIPVTVSRVSGEEFYFIVEGASNAELADLAEVLRTGLEGSPVPPRNHPILQEERFLDVQLPPDNECFRTASFGISGRIASGADTDAVSIASRLMNEADVAVSKAKASGRNRVIQFREIAKSHGRVLEHHAETNVVAIDIGKLVGVRRGQEFTVYHPQFNGTQPLEISDGRSKRQIGVYPRFPSGRIAVFDVQDEISFARVTESEHLPFSDNSHLEAIPLGSITHMLSSSLEPGTLAIASLREFKSAGASLREQGEATSIIVLRLTNSQVLERDNGEAAVNDALLRAYQTSLKPLRETRKSTQPDSSEIAFVFRAKQIPDTKALKALVTELETVAWPAHFRIGIYGSADGADDGRIDDSEQWVSSALDLARHAAGEPANSSVSVLDTTVAARILQQSYDAGEHETTILDYEFFGRMGILGGAMHNAALLAAYSVRSKEYALRCADLAVEALPKSAAIQSNRAIILAELQRWSESLAGFLESERLDQETSRANIHTYYSALAKLECALLGEFSAEIALDACFNATDERMPVQWTANLDKRKLELEERPPETG